MHVKQIMSFCLFLGLATSVNANFLQDLSDGLKKAGSELKKIEQRSTGNENKSSSVESTPESSSRRADGFPNLSSDLEIRGFTTGYHTKSEYKKLESSAQQKGVELGGIPVEGKDLVAVTSLSMKIAYGSNCNKTAAKLVEKYQGHSLSAVYWNTYGDALHIYFIDGKGSDNLNKDSNGKVFLRKARQKKQTQKMSTSKFIATTKSLTPSKTSNLQLASAGEVYVRGSLYCFDGLTDGNPSSVFVRNDNANKYIEQYNKDYLAKAAKRKVKSKADRASTPDF
ncbi:MAG: hypothetical protein MI976_11255 [Pseudomonadales bacterium]|nr:hypothetical protein [Pseudomonadales bacterium]